jgi:hypothetical protein
MSKFLPDPQIQSLRAMRAGDIAFGKPPAVPQLVGVSSVAQAQPIVTASVSPVAAPGQGPVSGPFNVAPVVGEATNTTLSQDAAISVSLSAVPTTPALDGTPSETPVVTVGTATSVI